ncbi:MAG: serine O-acetyltransferase [Pseudomonadales bacterium]
MTNQKLADLAVRIWSAIVAEVEIQSEKEPVLTSFYHSSILNHSSLGSALGFHIASKLSTGTVPGMLIQQVFTEAIEDNPVIINSIYHDLEAYYRRDPACDQYSMPFLYFKGFHALQAYRIGHWLWQKERYDLALFLQNRISTIFDVDIHPAAKLGWGIMIDHATGVVIGETAVIGNDVSLLHSVTLGGCGSAEGARHPKIAEGVLISAGAKLLGNISIGEGAKITAGSLVLEDVAAHTTVAGVPAKITGRPVDDQPALNMNQQIIDS